MSAEFIQSSYITVSNPHHSDGYLAPVNHNEQTRTVDSDVYENAPDLYDEPSDIDGNLPRQDGNLPEPHGNLPGQDGNLPTQGTQHTDEEQNYSDIYEHINQRSEIPIQASHQDNVHERPIIPENSNTYQQLVNAAPPPYTAQPGVGQANMTPGVSWTNQQFYNSGNQPVVIVIAPVSDDDAYEPSKCFSVMTLCVAIAHIILALVCIFLQIFIDIHKTVLSVAQAGIIVGVFSGTCGILGVFAYRFKFTKQGISVAMLVLSIICVILACMLICLAPIDLIITGLTRSYNDHSDNLKGDHMAANGILILGAFLGIVFGIWLSVIACIGKCRCCKSSCFVLNKEYLNRENQQNIHIGSAYNYQVPQASVNVASNLNKH